ncbi:MAG: aldo/keto reductase [Alphaproteobacteria bacterium]|nr:aldo/keto reductase [Alphaproteobacteria bacterium]
MEQRDLGSTGVALPAIGLGCMGMSDFYGPADRTESIATIHAAMERGVTLLDTGDFYGSGHNELLIAEALRGKNRDDAFVAVKFGAMRSPDGAFIGQDARPQAVKNALAYSLKRLGTDYVDLYQPARLDPNVPIEDTVGAIKEMIEAGYVRHLGLSEMGSDTIRRAAAVHPVAWLQIEYSLISREIEQSILQTTRALGISISAYGVLSRGLLSGHWSIQRSETARDFRATLPRFQGAALDHNLALVETIGQIAEEKGATTAQIAIAWVLAQGPDIIPLIGARTRERLTESLGALDLTLNEPDLARLNKAAPVNAAQGDRYPSPQMQSLDSRAG